MSGFDHPSDPFDSDSTETAFAEVVAEVGERLRRGEAVDPLDYPDFEAPLREILPTLRMVTELRGPTTPHVDLGRLGDFRIIREVGRGGMGVVYEAIQLSLDRRVALKVLPNASALDSKQLRRFQLEAQAAAGLQHPHIVEVYSTGTAEGTPYYAMRFIEGRDLAQVVRDRRAQNERRDTGASPQAASGGSRSFSRGVAFAREVARMALQAAEALEHAHACDVVHRDIKPSNLLVDEAGHVWITDFGLARIMGGLDLTLTGDLLGTPRYMSPEQALGRRGPFDGRADVYSLGVTIYELLTLHPAFPGDDRIDVLRRIAEEEPTAPRKLDPTIPVDLETIVLKAMAKAPADRYATAGDLAADLARFLDDRPIRARRPTLVDHAWKWTRRHRRLVTAGLAATVCVAVCLALAAFQYTVWLQKYTAVLRTAVARADQSTRLAERRAYVLSLRLAAQAVDDKRWERAQESLDAIEPSPDGDDPRDFSWYYLRRLARREIVLLPGPAVPTHEILLTRDGSKLFSRGVDQILTFWSFPRVAAPGRSGPFDAQDVVFSSDGRIVVGDRLGSGGRRDELAVWETKGGEIRMRFPLEASAEKLDRFFHHALLADGRLLACAWETGGAWPSVSLRIWNLHDTGPEPKPLVALDGLAYPVFAPSGERFVTLENEGVFVRDVSTGEVLSKLSDRGDATPAIVLSADGRWVAVGFPDGLIIIYDTSNGTERERRRLDVKLTSLWFGPGGDLIAASDATGAVHVWDRASVPYHKFDSRDPLDPNESDGVRAIAFSPDRRFLAVSPKRKPQGLLSAAVWELATGRRFGPPPSPDPATDSLVFTPDSRALVMGGLRSPRIWRFDPPPDPPPLAGHKDEAWSVAFSPDGKLLATGSDDTDEPQTIKIWDPASSALLRGWSGGVGTVASIAFSPDGRMLATGHLASTGNVRLWNVADGKLLAELSGHDDMVRTVAFSPNGAVLASGGRDQTIRLWDVAARRCIQRLVGHSSTVRSVAFSPDGRRLASASTSGAVRLWDPVQGSLLHREKIPTKLVAVAFSPDGALLATADEDGVVVLRDATTLALLRSIRGDIDPFLDLAFATDGRSLATSSKSGTIRVWDTLAGQELLTLRGHAAQVNDIAFSPDGRLLASCAHDGSVQLWRALSDDPFSLRKSSE
ncbi:Serine/threonine-protein kinase PrkC [Paludisphaera borealis]|uniref:Intraflagellar transport protein 122 homolog n=2 Tax=Paludisphaera borealis TaxID=1387353 RepID=A0A1U7CJB7_9BACT|nr:Serine/threonine-protein kinase PrkC [Paludisphaera borealis]